MIEKFIYECYNVDTIFKRKNQMQAFFISISTCKKL